MSIQFFDKQALVSYTTLFADKVKSMLDSLSATIDTKLLAKSDTGHTHDDRYYTEEEVDTKLAAATSGVVLFNGGDYTSDTITLSESIANYSTIEIIYGLSWSHLSFKAIVLPTGGYTDDAETRRIPMCQTYTNTNFINFYTGMCIIAGDTLYRGDAMATLIGETAEREKLLALNWGTSGTLTFKTTVYTNATGYQFRIYRVIGYK